MHHPPARRIADMSCLEIDALLALNFEWIELKTVLARANRLIPPHPGCLLDEPDFILALAHNECHAGEVVERTIHTMLDRRHRDLITAIRRDPPERLYTMVTRRRNSLDTGGVAWALLSDHRPCVAQCGMTLVRREVYNRLSQHTPVLSSM